MREKKIWIIWHHPCSLSFSPPLSVRFLCLLCCVLTLLWLLLFLIWREYILTLVFIWCNLVYVYSCFALSMAWMLCTHIALASSVSLGLFVRPPEWPSFFLKTAVLGATVRIRDVLLGVADSTVCPSLP